MDTQIARCWHSLIVAFVQDVCLGDRRHYRWTPFSHTLDSSTGTALDQCLGHDGSKEVQDSSACPACGGKPHEQLVCADVKAGKRERNDVNDARNCRTCLMPLPKLECADLVICAACKTQICWQCEEEFEVNATAEVFNHFDVFEDRGRNNP